MKVTDYSTIAARYDDNPVRHYIPRDEYIERHYTARRPIFCVLDLACGTGNYLAKQISEYRNHSISWIGIDKSPEMLSVAKKKGISAELLIGDACDVPLDGSSVDYVSVRFAFHHFQDKQKAVAELARVIRPGGGVRVFNLAHEYMRSSWIYRYFPGAEPIDRDRFVDGITMFKWFTGHGFNVELDVHTVIRQFVYDDIIKEVENRDMSQLNLITETEYRDGLSKMRADAEHTDGLLGDIAFMDLYARKIG